MTDPTRPDDELVSAVLDGEADEADQAAVQADPDLRARLETFRSVRAAVGADLTPADEHRREAAIAAALAEAVGTRDGAADGPVVDLATARARRASRARPVLVAGAAIVTVLALAGGLSRLVGSGDDASTQAADAPADATAESGAAGGAAASDLALGPVDDPTTLAREVAEATGLGGVEGGIGGDTAFDAEPAAPAEDGVEADLAAPRAADEGDRSTGGDRTAEDCTVELIEARPGLTGQLAHGTVTYQGIDAWVFVYHDPATDGVLAIVMSTADCSVLTEVPF